MLRLQNHFLSAVRAASPLHRLLLSTATTSTSPVRFVAEEYLVPTCGLTPAQAFKASKGLTHVKSPANPDAVLAFFAGVGLAKADVAAAIARYSRLLCSKVDKTLTPRFAQLLSIGLTPSQISRLITIVPIIFSAPSMISNLQFYLSFMGSYDQVHFALKRNPFLLSLNLECVVKPNMAFLQQCGLTPPDVAEFSRLLAVKPERVKELVAHAEKLGVARGTGMFKAALWAVWCMGPDNISAKLDFLKTTFGCSEAEMALVVSKAPQILRISEGKLSRTVKYLTVELGLKPQYIAYRPALLSYSMQRRLMPRHYVIKVLKAKGLVKEDIDFYNVVCSTEKRFKVKFLDRYKESVPGLADSYVTACLG